jgi:hypothetical protein
MSPSDCKPGARVRYRPVIGRPESYLGTVRELPWHVGDCWVTHLTDVDRPERRYVHAASLTHLELIEPAPKGNP